MDKSINKMWYIYAEVLFSHKMLKGTDTYNTMDEP